MPLNVECYYTLEVKSGIVFKESPTIHIKGSDTIPSKREVLHPQVSLASRKRGVRLFL